MFGDSLLDMNTTMQKTSFNALNSSYEYGGCDTSHADFRSIMTNNDKSINLPPFRNSKTSGGVTPQITTGTAAGSIRENSGTSTMKNGDQTGTI
jgi:hypothetical protein